MSLEGINKVSKSNCQSKRVKTSFKNQNIKRNDIVSHLCMKSKKNYKSFEKLGINNMSLRCGSNNHLPKDCQLNPNNLLCKKCVSKHYSNVRDQTVLKYQLIKSKHMKILL